MRELWGFKSVSSRKVAALLGSYLRVVRLGVTCLSSRCLLEFYQVFLRDVVGMVAAHDSTVGNAASWRYP